MAYLTCSVRKKKEKGGAERADEPRRRGRRLVPVARKGGRKKKKDRTAKSPRSHFFHDLRRARKKGGKRRAEQKRCDLPRNGPRGERGKILAEVTPCPPLAVFLGWASLAQRGEKKKREKGKREAILCRRRTEIASLLGRKGREREGKKGEAQAAPFPSLRPFGLFEKLSLRGKKKRGGGSNPVWNAKPHQARRRRRPRPALLCGKGSSGPAPPPPPTWEKRRTGREERGRAMPLPEFG